jgi:hypothetical protein
MPSAVPLTRSSKFFHRHSIIVDPYVLLLVTFGAALASGFFAWQTNAINDEQRELAKRQTELQALQMLPSFSLTRRFHDSRGALIHEERAAVSDWIDVSNQGGLARNFDIFEYPVVVLTHEDLANGSVEIPLDGYTNKEILLRSGDFSATDAETLEAVMDLIRLRNGNATSPQTIPAGVTAT